MLNRLSDMCKEIHNTEVWPLLQNHANLPKTHLALQENIAELVETISNFDRGEDRFNTSKMQHDMAVKCKKVQTLHGVVRAKQVRFLEVWHEQMFAALTLTSVECDEETGSPDKPGTSLIATNDYANPFDKPY